MAKSTHSLVPKLIIDLENVIKTLRGNCWIGGGIGLGLILIGGTITLVVSLNMALTPTSEPMKLGPTVAGFGISLFQIRMVLANRERISYLRFLINRLQNSRNLPEAQMDRLLEEVNDALKKLWERDSQKV
jgi:hypothetical protein